MIKIKPIGNPSKKLSSILMIKLNIFKRIFITLINTINHLLLITHKVYHKLLLRRNGHVYYVINSLKIIKERLHK